MNFPGYFLRHRNHEAWVEQRDGSTTLHSKSGTVPEAAGLRSSFHTRSWLKPGGSSRELATCPLAAL
ncbi:AbfB domain-containing protein [Nonomuraea sp. NPDC004297]